MLFFFFFGGGCIVLREAMFSNWDTDDPVKLAQLALLGVTHGCLKRQKNSLEALGHSEVVTTVYILMGVFALFLITHTGHAHTNLCRIYAQSHGRHASKPGKLVENFKLDIKQAGTEVDCLLSRVCLLIMHFPHSHQITVFDRDLSFKNP